MTTALVGTEILTFTEGDIWVACWVRRHIVSQGETEQQAVASLLDAIALTWIWAEEYMARGEKVGEAPKPPDHVVFEWRKSHEACHQKEPRAAGEREKRDGP